MYIIFVAFHKSGYIFFALIMSGPLSAVRSVSLLEAKRISWYALRGLCVCTDTDSLSLWSGCVFSVSALSDEVWV